MSDNMIHKDPKFRAGCRFGLQYAIGVVQEYASRIDDWPLSEFMISELRDEVFEWRDGLGEAETRRVERGEPNK